MHEFSALYLLSSSDAESVAIADLLALEPDATDRLLAQRLGYTECVGASELRAARARLVARLDVEDVWVAWPAARLACLPRPRRAREDRRPKALHDDLLQAETCSWVRPTAGPIGFARLHGVEDTTGFCERLVTEAGMLAPRCGVRRAGSCSHRMWAGEYARGTRTLRGLDRHTFLTE